MYICHLHFHSVPNSFKRITFCLLKGDKFGYCNAYCIYPTNISDFTMKIALYNAQFQVEVGGGGSVDLHRGEIDPKNQIHEGKRV